METKLEKPRLKYSAEHFAARQKLGYPEGSLAWVIERVIKDVQENPDLPQWGRTKLGRARIIQGRPIGAVDAVTMTEQHLIDFLKERRREDGIGPATALHDITVISTAVDYHISTWRTPNLSAAVTAVTIAKKFCKKNRITAKANRRTRRPTDEEIGKILADCQAHDASPRTKYKCYTDFVLFGLGSARRRGEVARMKWGDFDFEKNVYWVRDMKHPTKKKGNDKPFILWPSLKEIVLRQPRKDPNDPTERVFPLNDNSIGAFYCEVKNKYGITDLRLHDNRGDATSKWILKIGRDKTRKLVTGHDSEKAFDVYDRRSTEDIVAADEALQKLLEPAQISASAA